MSDSLWDLVNQARRVIEKMKNQKANLIIYEYGKEHPLSIMENLGITYKSLEHHHYPINQWEFFDCENIPDDLPSFITKETVKTEQEFKKENLDAKEKIALLKTAIKYIRQDRDQLKRAGYSDTSMKGFNRSIMILEEMIEEIKEGK